MVNRMMDNSILPFKLKLSWISNAKTQLPAYFASFITIDDNWISVRGYVLYFFINYNYIWFKKKMKLVAPKSKQIAESKVYKNDWFRLKGKSCHVSDVNK